MRSGRSTCEGTEDAIVDESQPPIAFDPPRDRNQHVGDDDLTSRVESSLERIESYLAQIARDVRRIAASVDAPEADVGRLYTRREAAEILEVSTRTVDRLILGGTLSVQRRGRSVRVTGGSIRHHRHQVRSDQATRVLQL